MARPSSSTNARCESCDAPKNLDVIGQPIKGVYTGAWSNICRRCRHTAQKRMWTSFSAWEDLLRANLTYLDGHIDVSPNYDVPISPETTRLLPGLKRLHEYGLLSTNSQPGDQGLAFKAETGCIQWKQRPYYDFLVPTVHESVDVAKVNRLVDALMKHEDIVTTAWSDSDEYPKSKEGDVNEAREVAPTFHATAQNEAGEGTDKTYYFRSNASPRVHWVSSYRKANSSKELRDTEWTNQTRSGPTNVDEIPRGSSTCGNGPEWERFPGVMNARPLAVQVAAREWTTKLDLQEVVERTCQRVGLGKMFKSVLKRELMVDVPDTTSVSQLDE
ncbi:methylenetetrahydrofolate reductase (NAD(P)H) met13 [Didymosphaeria variabile]|uniref:Methylenetetrahydrofolate reductase (NAD(P)H) met13 n=1 Tax=Didymosphaeria variabile TaxID=1932322 RepID=A0A9W8XN58_9PLEO|nr:methylenetetrahydrofolate reductase (NAD(P)H) met13 [Didymosphaeria variabile]KAJ4355710.1 methylenetetrahydrofolate reductase (NAD(P)H) met13 [Didymosphaeria variabile]